MGDAQHGEAETAQAVEIEIKFKTSREGLRLVLQSPLLKTEDAPLVQSLRSVYYDTPERDLWKAGIVMRVRRSGRSVPVLSIKSSPEKGGNPFLRREVEVRAPKGKPDLALFDRPLADELDVISNGKPLQPMFETVVRRSVISPASGGSIIEVACDEGHIVADKRRESLREVELELKSGDESGLYDVALQLAGGLPLSLDFISKSQRGFFLVEGTAPAPSKAEAVQLSRKASVEEALVAIAAASLHHFIANWAALRGADHPEAIHQMRVALRRLSTALAIFGREIACPDFQRLRNEARRIAAGLGPARDCDVFCEQMEQGPLTSNNRPPGCESLMAIAGKYRQRAYRDARYLIDHRDTTLFVLAMQAFLAGRTWRDGFRSNLAEPAQGFACRVLDRLQARALRRGKNFSSLGDDARHRLRIALKSQRYGAEFFASLFGRRRQIERYIANINTLQDLLGTQNDVAMAKHVMVRLTPPRAADVEAAKGFILGWHAHSAPLAAAKLHGAWKKFKGAKPFWK